MDDATPLRNPRTGQIVTRIVKAKHRDLTRDVVLQRTGEVVTILCTAYDPTMHAALDSVAPPVEEAPKPTRKKKRAKKKKR